MAATNFEKTVKGEKLWSFSSVFSMHHDDLPVGQSLC